jgi:hypothetical protein
LANDDDLNDLFKNLTSRQRLVSLRMEMLTPLAVIHGYATLLARINLEDPSTFPKDYGQMIENILQAHNHIRMVADALASDIPDD